MGVKLLELHNKSRLMQRVMPYYILLPNGYEESNLNYPVLYLLHGLFGRYDNWITLTKLKDYAAAYNLIIVTPEGGDGWYTDSPTVPADKFESYFIDELIPEIDRTYRTNKDRAGRFIAGLSMGGYGVLKFGVKYPQLFVSVSSMSGAFDAAARTDETPGSDWKEFKPSIMQAFGDKDSHVRRENNLHKLYEELPVDKIDSLPFIYFDCGKADSFLTTNRDLAEILTRKKIKHEYLEFPGGHDWDYWGFRVRHILNLTDKLCAISER